MPYEPFMDWRIAAARGLDNISTIHKLPQQHSKLFGLVVGIMYILHLLWLCV
jgi:hypothetical protein